LNGAFRTQMTSQNLTYEDKYRHIARDTERRMEDTIAMANQCNDLGDQTLAMLAIDREKLLRVDQDLDFINSSLQRAEYHLHSMESWGGAIGNYFRGQPKPERSGTLAAKHARKHNVDEKAPPCPPSVWRGSKLNEMKVQKFMEDSKLHSFFDGEYVMYLCSNAGARASVSKACADCVVLTNLRAFEISAGKRVVADGKNKDFALRSVECAELIKGTLMKYDRVRISMWGGRTYDLSFWNRKSSLFMLWVFNRIPVNSRKWNGIPSVESGNASREVRKARAVASGARSGNISEPVEGESEIQKMAREHNARIDDHLDDLSAILDNVAFKAKMIGDEVREQNKLTKHINERVEETHVRLKASDKRGRKLLRR